MGNSYVRSARNIESYQQKAGVEVNDISEYTAVADTSNIYISSEKKSTQV